MLTAFLSNGSLKNQLQKNVFRLIHQHGRISKNELLSLTQTKLTTLNRMLDELLKANFIRESGYGESSGGRPPILYEVNPSCAYMIGIDISRIETKVVFVDVKFGVIEKASFMMTDQHEPNVVFSQIKDMITEWLNMYGVSFDQLLGIGVGTVGPVRRDQGVIVNPEAFLAPNWDQVNVTDILKETFPVNIVVDNGANSAVVAAYTQHHFSYQNILYMIGGYGIRCGVINNGQLIHAKQGDASACGHITVQAGGKLCLCGKRGCLSAYATFGAITRELKGVLGEGEPVVADVVAQMNQGHKQVKQVLALSAYYYGIGIANMINVLHPELVILHGNLIFASDWYYEQLVANIRKHIYMEKDNIYFSKAELGTEAITIGAAIQVFQSYF